MELYEITSKIYDKLITDFAALKYEDGVTVTFGNVKSFFADGTMSEGDCLILPISAPEQVTGPSAGNMQTTRILGFSATTFEILESAISQSAGEVKMRRLTNKLDVMLKYLQKEPSNLNAWGQTNEIDIYKIRVDLPRFAPQRSTAGFTYLLEVPFSVYLNVVPQNL